MRYCVVLDCETSGLSPQYHDIWELAVVERASRTEHRWLMEPSLTRADPEALRIGRFAERTKHTTWNPDNMPGPHDLTQGGDWWSEPYTVAGVLCPMLADVTLIGAVPGFDTQFLAPFLARGGCPTRWHYRIRDIGSIAYGYLYSLGRDGAIDPDALLPPLDASTDDFACALGLDPGKYDRHTALGDCRLVADMLDIVEGRWVAG